jgi:hypothetical protein
MTGTALLGETAKVDARPPSKTRHFLGQLAAALRPNQKPRTPNAIAIQPIV